jgi:hypothetical protein
MTNEQRKEINDLSREVSRCKSDLLNIAGRLEGISPAQAAKLTQIIGRLEAWQVRLPRPQGS